MLNRCEFIGNLGRDPEVRTTQSGSRVVNLNLAVSERWTKDGERQEKTEWVSVVIWNEKIGEVAEKYLKKGDKVYIAGQLSTRKWTDQQGQERTTTEIVLQRFRGELVLLGGGNRDEGERLPEHQPERGERRGRMSDMAAPRSAEDLDDDIPF